MYKKKKGNKTELLAIFTQAITTDIDNKIKYYYKQ